MLTAHLPFFWLCVATVALPLLASRGYLRAGLVFFAAILMHLILDTIEGKHSMKTLVFGESGQVATALRARAGDAEVICLGRDQADLGTPDMLRAVIEATDADVIINAAAYTAVTKRRGEEALEMAGGPYAVLRTSWVFSATGQNFVKTMLRLGADHDALRIVGDQIGGPTAAADIADALLTMARAFTNGSAHSGIYHVSGAPDCSWAAFATEIFAQANIACTVTPIPTTDYPTPAARPLNSRLDCTTLETVFGIKRPDWRQSLTATLKDIT